MYLVLVGVLLVVLKFADVSPVAEWSWLWVLAPFAGAALWWAYSDMTGLTSRREMDKIEDKKETRRRNAFAALGLDYRRAGRDKTKTEAFRRVRQAQIDKVEGKRDTERKRHADTMSRASRFSSQLDSTHADEGDTAPAVKK